jgi:hypothetical protein
MPAPFVPKKAGNYDKKYCEVIEKISDTTLERYQNYLNQKNFKHVFDGYTCINIEMIQNTINDTVSNNLTGTKSNKLSGKTSSSTKADIINKLHSNTNELSSRTNKQNTKNKEEIVIEKNPDNEKLDILHQLNYLSFSEKDREKERDKEKDKESKPSLKGEQKSKEDNHNLSLQKFLNYSKQKRLKFAGLNKNIMRQKPKENEDESTQREKGKLSNLSDLDPSIINNFKKIGANFEERNKKVRSSSVCYSSKNDHNVSNSKSNKAKNIQKSGKTLEVNKINQLYNLINLNHKGSLTGKNMDKNKKSKINFKENFSPFKVPSPYGSPKNANRGNLILQNELSNFNAGFKTNRRMNLYLPNLLKERTLSPTFRNGLKLKKKMNINIDILQHIKMKIKEKKLKHKGVDDNNYIKLMNGNNSKNKTAYNGFKKRNDSTNLLNRFIYNNKKMKNRDYSSRRNKNLSENKSHLEEKQSLYGNGQNKKLKHNFSVLNI